MTGRDIPPLGFDPTREALIEPSRVIRTRDLPERAVLCFFREVVAQVASSRPVKSADPLRSEMGELPVHRMEYEGEEIAFAQAGVGAPLAAGFLEELIARGCRKFILCGGAGVLDGSIESGRIIVPLSAVRDEGTSRHYLPEEREATASPEAVRGIETVLTRRNIGFLKGKTWTTDGLYRETPDRIASRRRQGCLTVEMEAAALFAVAEFRQVQVGMMLYGGDDVSGSRWDSRDWSKKLSVREALFWLAMEACREME